VGPPVTTAASAPPAPQTVTAAAGAITSLIAGDVTSGAIDPRAARALTSALGKVLGSDEKGDVSGAQQKLADLSQAVTVLAGHEAITPSSASALGTALGGLGSAIAAAGPPAEADVAPPGPGASGGDGRGHAKHKHDGHGGSEGD
jgi:hypothetical protein